jgi:peptidoglycan-associated lipoprotein
MSVPPFARLALMAGLLAGVAACSTTAMNTGPGPQEPPPPVSTTPDETNQPAAGFENVKPGSEEDFILNVSRRTFFAADSAALDSTARTTLDNQAAWLKQHTSWLVKLQGFADDSGGDGAQVALSQKRADVVMNYLVAAGVDANRMWAKGYGKDREVRACAERSCKVQNRRVVTNLRTVRDD